MSVISNLHSIQGRWVTSAAAHLASKGPIREGVREELERFFLLLIQAVEAGEPQLLDPLLDDWIAARTRTNLDASVNSIAPILQEVLPSVIQACQEQLSAQETVAVIAAVLPIQYHMFSYVAQEETIAQVESLSSELDAARQSLEQLDRSKSDFISIAAHELKTPLTLIEGYSAMLWEQPPIEQDPYQQMLLKGIDNGTRRLREIINDMVDVSLIDNNLLILNFQPVWIDRLVEMVRDEFSEILAERSLLFKFDTFPGIGEMNYGDGERLYQTFCNLLTNAIKYTPDGGTITVDGRLLPGFIEIRFTDTGIGIDPEDQVRIFEKFGRVGSVSLHSSGKTKFKGGGPGLGLPIAKGIIEAHGGTIWVESAGRDEAHCPGAVFHVLLPLRSTPPDDKIAHLFQIVESAHDEKME